MPKLLNLLAASVGGGVLLGVLFRPASLETATSAELVGRIEGQASEIAELRSRLSETESEVRNHSAAISELRECTMQASRNTQKLLDGIDRLVAAQRRNGARSGEAGD